MHVTTNSFTDGITKKRQEEEKKENSLDHTCTGDESKTNSENTKAENVSSSKSNHFTKQHFTTSPPIICN